MTIVDELKKKIVAAGGDATGVQTISDGVKKMPAGGGGNNMLIVWADGETLDTTWQELFDAMYDGKLCMVRSWEWTPGSSKPYTVGCSIIMSCSDMNNTYSVSTSNGYVYAADSANGYPTYTGK